MLINKFRIGLVLRVVAIVLVALVFTYCIIAKQWYFTAAVAALLIILQIVALVYYLEKLGRELSKFVLSVKHKDFTQTYISLNKRTSFYELKTAFKSVYEEIQQYRVEREIQFHFLQRIVEHLTTAVICYVEDGHVVLRNKALMSLIKKEHIEYIDDIDEVSPFLREALQKVESDTPSVFAFETETETFHLSLRATKFKLHKIDYKLITLQNIRSELEAQELESWQKLVKVLRHEIMNSVTPIASLTEAVNDILWDGKRQVPLCDIGQEEAEDIYQCLKIVESRSKGLIHFINSYKSYTQIPQINRVEVDLKDLLFRLKQLLQGNLDEKGIKCVISVEEELLLSVDKSLIEQVFLNLMLNSIDALKNIKNPEIRIEGKYGENGREIIYFSDNGKGISKEEQENIFVPFYTTRKNGSGIGLSLSKRILQQHNATISLDVETEVGTTFILKF